MFLVLFVGRAEQQQLASFLLAFMGAAGDTHTKREAEAEAEAGVVPPIDWGNFVTLFSFLFHFIHGFLFYISFFIHSHTLGRLPFI